MVTAKRKTKKRYPGCLAHAVTGMFYSVVANQRQPRYTYNVLQRRCQPRPTIICIYFNGGGTKSKPQNRTDFNFFGGGKRRVSERSKHLKHKSEIKNKANGRGGAQALMHHLVAVERTPSPERRMKCAHTTSRPYPAAARNQCPEARD